MTPERFRRVDQLVSLALKRSAHGRAEFLREACAGEEDLRIEVESLLASHDNEDGFLAEAPARLAAELLEEKAVEEIGTSETRPVSSAIDPLVGRVLSHYRLDERLGAGGMGVLYRATDLKLGRAVAIKLLARHLVSDETAKARFIREARSASALDHPNIATVHEIGEAEGELFIAMALYKGQTLKQRLDKARLDVKEAVDVLRQVSLGLEAAHRAGIVHRDIKPANILITSTGTVKILDFGLAKLVSDSQAETVTQTGQTMGTVLYMSPEQLRGESVDSRSDLWSLGVVAYEVLAGVSPFQTDSSAATMARILHEEPPSLASVPSVPDWLGQLVSRLLRKNPAERLPSASDVLVRLSEHSLEGLVSEVINALANVNRLRVASRTSAFAFKGEGVDVRQIGEKLNVGAVLDGSLRREGDRLRISSQLINVADGYHLWSNVYEGELKNIFALEDELARPIAQALKPKLVQTDAVPRVKPATANLAAHDLYLKGRYFWNKRTAEALTKAIGYFQLAIEQHPSYALAYLGLADTNALLLEYGSASAAEMLSKAKQAALEALELDGTLAEAHASLGLISQYNYEWTTAEEELQRAIELNPEYATAHHWYALLLSSIGRLKEARAEAERARQLDPTSLIINNIVTLALYTVRDYHRAIEQAKKTLELDSNFVTGLEYLALVYLAESRYADAVTELEKLRATFAVLPSCYAGELGYAYAMSRRRADALRMLAELEERSKHEYVSPSAHALIYMGLGEKDQAFAWLDTAYAERDWRLRELKAYPLFDSLRSDPRFTQLLKQIHLE